MVVLCNDHLLDDRDLREQSGVRPFDLERVNPDNWRAAMRYWGSSLRKLNIGRDTWDWMSTFLPSDSTRECYGLGQVALAGAVPAVGNPHQWGFDLHVVVDRFGKLLGARMLPGLAYTGPDGYFVFWPQVSLRTAKTTFRLDGLMFYRRGSERYWLVVEFDAEGHNFVKDPYRTAQLGMLEVRISGEEIRQKKTFALLTERAEAEIAGLATGSVAV